MITTDFKAGGESIGITADDFAAVDRPERDPRHGVNRVFHEVDRAVAEEGIDSARMPAACPHEHASRRALVVACQASNRLAVAKPADTSKSRGAGSGCRATKCRQVIHVVVGQGAPQAIWDAKALFSGT